MSYTEQDDLHTQNDRLALYIQRVREQGQGASPATLKALLKDLEDEASRQRSFYQREVEKLRRQLEDAVRAKNAAESDTEAQQRDAESYRSRYQDEAKKNHCLLDDLEKANKRICELEQEVTEARATARGPQDKVKQLQDDVGKAMMRYDAANNELIKEKGKNKDLHSQLNNALSKQDYSKRAYEEQLKDKDGRVENAKRLVADLEAKNRALEEKNAQMPARLEEMRKKNAEEMRSYKDQAEYNNNKNMTDLKKNFNALSSQVDTLREENARLQSDNDDAKKWMKAMETRASELKSQKEALEQQLKAEREKNAQNMKDAEKRLKELNELVMTKMQENNTTRDIQASLRAEIETYRQLLDEEGVKQGQRGSSSSGGMRGGGGTTWKRDGTGAGRTGLGSASSTGSGRNKLGSGYGASGASGAAGAAGRTHSGNQKLPLRALKTEYMDNYTPKRFAYSSSWDARRKNSCELPRVE